MITCEYTHQLQLYKCKLCIVRKKGSSIELMLLTITLTGQTIEFQSGQMNFVRIRAHLSAVRKNIIRKTEVCQINTSGGWVWGRSGP